MKKSVVPSIAAAAVMLVISHGAGAETNGVPADNTKSNKTDSSNMTATADSQPENNADRTLTQQIRKDVMADKSLSTYAHNIKIVSVNGSVTLNGVVRSEAEKMALEKAAARVAGKEHVANALKVEPAK